MLLTSTCDLIDGDSQITEMLLATKMKTQTKKKVQAILLYY